jgi:glycosyltransferase involved in cell wall biosynthesis
MIESLGRGGFFNHSVEVTAGLLELGVDVTLHTATDPEAAPAGLNLCRCISWYRRSTSRFVRRSRTTARYLTRTLPHLARVIGAEDVVHIQGTFALTPEVISVAKLRNATVVCSPHNTFVRDGAIGNGRVLASVLRRADRVLVYSDADAAILGDRMRNVGRVPLVQWTPPVDAARAASWRASLAGGGSRLAVMPGYVRADKNCDIFVRALALMPGWRGAIVGEDLGGGPELNRLIEELDAPVTTQYRYLDVDEFVALVAASDVVAAPYRVASQSGVLAVADRLGVPRATAPTGGLIELATAVARDSSPQSLRDAIVEAFETGATPSRAVAVDAAGKFLEEYRTAHADRRRTVAAQETHR